MRTKNTQFASYLHPQHRNLPIFDFRSGILHSFTIHHSFILLEHRERQKRSEIETPTGEAAEKRREKRTEKLSRFHSSRKFPFVNSILFANWTNIVFFEKKERKWSLYFIFYTMSIFVVYLFDFCQITVSADIIVLQCITCTDQRHNNKNHGILSIVIECMYYFLPDLFVLSFVVVVVICWTAIEWIRYVICYWFHMPHSFRWAEWFFFLLLHSLNILYRWIIYLLPSFCSLDFCCCCLSWFDTFHVHWRNGTKMMTKKKQQSQVEKVFISNYSHVYDMIIF